MFAMGVRGVRQADPIWAYAYMTSPEQSNPPGEAPPQTYGTPRYDIAIETTWLPYDGGGTTVAPSGVEALAPTTLL